MRLVDLVEILAKTIRHRTSFSEATVNLLPLNLLHVVVLYVHQRYSCIMFILRERAQEQRIETDRECVMHERQRSGPLKIIDRQPSDVRV